MFLLAIIGLISSTAAFGQIQFDIETVQIGFGESILRSPIIKTTENGNIVSVYKTNQTTTFCRVDSSNSSFSFVIGNSDVIDFFILDLNQDDDEDLVVCSSYKIYVFSLEGEYLYSIPFEEEIVAINMADLDGDGEKDIIFKPRSTNLLVILSSGDYQEIPFKWGDDCKILTEDIDRNGQEDIIILGRDTNPSGVYVFLNQDGFSNYNYFGLSNSMVNSMTIAQTGDNKKSIIINSPWNLNVPNNTLIINYDDGEFIATSAHLPAGFCSSSLSCDLDGDGIDELVYLSGYCTQLEIVKISNNTLNVVANIQIDEPSIWSENQNLLAKADINTDGKQDIVFLSDVGTIYKFLNITSPSQQINIQQGWSGISSYLIPETPAMEDVLQPIADQLIIAKTMAGGIYYPGENINTIGNWESQSAYVIKTSAACTLPITGNYETDMTVSLNAGWSLLPVLSSDEILVDNLFSGVDLVIAKEIAGAGIYWPEYGINSLGYLIPGKAYYVLLTQNGEVNYADLKSTSGVREISRSIDPREFGIEATPSTHTIAILPEALNDFETGTIVGAYDQEGNCFGITVVYNREPISLTVFGDDPMTPEKDGFSEGETMNFKANNDEIQISFDSKFHYSGDFVSNGISLVTDVYKSVTLQSPLIDINESIYPNPAIDILNVEMEEIPEYVQIIDVTGKVLLSPKVYFQKFELDVSSFPKGVYFVKVTFKNGAATSAKFIK